MGAYEDSLKPVSGDYIANEGPSVPTLSDVLNQGPFDAKIEELIAEGRERESTGECGRAATCYREALEAIRARWDEIVSKAPTR